MTQVPSRFDSTPQLEGKCLCGAVGFLVKPPTILKAYCHCSLCQRITGCPFIHTIHFPESGFEWRNNHDNGAPIEEKLETFSFVGKPHKIRYRCKKCGAGVAVYNKLLKKYCVWGALFPRYGDSDEIKMGNSEPGGSGPGEITTSTEAVVVGRIRQDVWDIIKPDAHIFYGTRMLDVDDGLEKWEGYAGSSKRL